MAAPRSCSTKAGELDESREQRHTIPQADKIAAPSFPDFDAALSAAGSKLVVVDFTASCEFATALALAPPNLR